jgi:anti-sigma factor RsiW
MTSQECRARSRMLGPYLDGELEASTLVQLDEHVSGCEVCGEEVRLLRAMRGSLKRVVRSAAPNELRDRMFVAMGAERAREARADADVNLLDGGGAGGFLSWQTMVPLATAAAIALMWGSATRANQPMLSESHAGFGDDLLAELVAEHSQPLPPEAVSAQAVRGLERYIGVPVHPTSFERAGAHLVGGRLMPLRPERAAMLQYVVGSGDAARRVSVFVYDAQKVQVGTANLAPRAVGTAQVRVGREKGYSVAATQRAGVGYLLMGDLDPEETAQLAAAVYEDR